MNELALFAGAGGGILGGKLLGWKCVCAVEFDEYARSVLKSRQDDGSLDPFPIWDDVRTFDGRPWRGRVEVVSGGFPCQDISTAGGAKGNAQDEGNASSAGNGKSADSTSCQDTKGACAGTVSGEDSEGVLLDLQNADSINVIFSSND
jgi:hypothetical protein